MRALRKNAKIMLSLIRSSLSIKDIFKKKFQKKMNTPNIYEDGAR